MPNQEEMNNIYGIPDICNNGLNVYTPSFHTKNIDKSVYETLNLNRNHFLNGHVGVNEHSLEIRRESIVLKLWLWHLLQGCH